MRPLQLSYQSQERGTEHERDHPAPAGSIAASSADNLHAVAAGFRRPLGRLQGALQPPAGVLPLVKQGVFLLVVVVVVVLHAGEANVFLLHHGVSDGGGRHNVTCQIGAMAAAGAAGGGDDDDDDALSDWR